MANNFENSIQGVKEIENKVRKAGEFNLDELNLSKRTYSFVRNIPPKELVFGVRTGQLHVRSMWKVCYEELYAAVDSAGFIRHDFDPQSLGVGALYRAIMGIYESGKPYAYLRDFESNEAYEDYRNLSQEQLNVVHWLLDELGTSFRDNCYKTVVQLRFGFIDGKRLTLDEIGSICHITKERARQIENRVLQKLKQPSMSFKLETILLYSSSEEYNKQINTIEEELLTLRMQMDILEKRILNFKKYSPFATTADTPWRSDFNFSSHIAALHFSDRAYNCLMRASIKTVGDLVAHCAKNPNDWDKKIPNLGKKCAQEIAETLTILGWQISIDNLS